MTRQHLWRILGLAATIAGLLPSPPAAQTQRFTGRLTIREREVLVDLPYTLEDDPLKPGAFQVLVDGEPREVTRAEPVSAGAEAPWTIVVYVDRVLAGPGTVFYSGLSLAKRTAALTSLGTVEVIVADSDPRTALAPTRDPRPLSRLLIDLAATARVERDQTERRLTAPSAPEAPRLRRQLDKLLDLLTAHPPRGPHAVLLVADGFDLPDEQVAALDRGDRDDRGRGGAPQTAAAALQRTARLLSAYGWVTIPVPLRKEEAGLPASTQTEIELFREATAPSDHQNGVPPVIPFKAPKGTSLVYPGVIDLMIAPRTAALRALSRPTAGTVVGYEVQLDEILAALGRRWRLWFAEPDVPVSGHIASFAVHLPGQRQEVRAPAWLRSSTPEEIAEIRLEDHLAGRSLDGGLPLSATMVTGPAGPELRLEVAPIHLPEDTPAGPLRLSWAWAGPDGAAGIHHQILPAGDLTKGWRHTERLTPPAGGRRLARLAIIVEALGPETWGGVALDGG